MTAVRHLTERRTIGAYASKEDADQGVRDFARLMNGMPVGFVLLMGRKMGAWVLYSLPCEVHEAMVELFYQDKGSKPNGEDGLPASGEA